MVPFFISSFCGTSLTSEPTFSDSHTTPQRTPLSARAKRRMRTSRKPVIEPHLRPKEIPTPPLPRRYTEYIRKRPGVLNLESCPALVLNADYQPLSYLPLSLWPWQDVMKAVFLERVNIVEVYDIGVRSCRDIFPLPSVVSLKQYQSINHKRPAFTRFNVFLRDDFDCQYCGGRFATQDLTFDHVIPRCRGGKTNWQNVVTACVDCNLTKGRHSLKTLKGKMHLLKDPVEPSTMLLHSHAKKYPPRYLHHTWRDYVYWSSDLTIEE